MRAIVVMAGSIACFIGGAALAKGLEFPAVMFFVFGMVLSYWGSGEE